MVRLQQIIGFGLLVCLVYLIGSWVMIVYFRVELWLVTVIAVLVVGAGAVYMFFDRRDRRQFDQTYQPAAWSPSELDDRPPHQTQCNGCGRVYCRQGYCSNLKCENFAKQELPQYVSHLSLLKRS